MSPHHGRGKHGLPLAILMALILPGCEGIVGPETPPTTTIRGRVEVDGRPVGPGWLEISPIDGTLGVLRSAPIAADGTFEASGVPIGPVSARLAGRPPERTGDPRLDGFLNNAHRMAILRLTIAKGDPGPIVIDMRDQLRAFEAALQAAK